jgi:15-cis-phytoene desaturase
MDHADVIVVGAGLSGLACAFELASAGRRVVVLEAQPHLGGRTASWLADGMPVESGFHRFRGIYRALPALLARAGLALDSEAIRRSAPGHARFGGESQRA